MSRATSLLLRFTMLALAVNAGCAFPFFRSKDKSLDEVVTVEAMSEQEAEAAMAAAAETPQPSSDAGEKPMPPIARFFGGLFGRGKQETPAAPKSTIPVPNEAPRSSVANQIQPKIEFNNTEAVGAGVVPASTPKPSPAAEVGSVAGSGASKFSTPTAPTAKPQASETVAPPAVATAPQGTATPPMNDAAAKPTYASQSPRSQGGSLTAALRSALDEASKDGLAQEAPAQTSSAYAAAAQPNPATMAAPATTPNDTQIVDLSSSPIGATKPTVKPAVPVAQTVENPTIGSSQIVNVAPRIDNNPLRSDVSTSGTRMVELTTQPIGARAETPQVVYPTKNKQPAVESTESTTLVAFQSHVHAGASIVNQLKQSRRVNEYRDMYEGETPASPAAQSAAAAVQAVPSPAIPTPSRATVVAAVPSTLPPQVETPVEQPAPSLPPQSQASVPPRISPQPRPAVVAATPTPQPTPTPVEIAVPVQPATPPQPAMAATAPLANPATINPPTPTVMLPESQYKSARSETLAQLTPSAPGSEGALEQPGTEPVELPAASIHDEADSQLTATHPNPVRAVPRVATPPQTAGTPSAPRVASRPTTTEVEPLLLPSQTISSAKVSPLDSPKLAPVVTVEEYRRMQQMRRNQQSTQRY
ncbi:hypothetical protein [Blastopirellula marina]|uniref:Uncharacterized protein n=1 Tax=Blastopirellula marina TaxID=124 RepID=A0A2S8GJW5_9BACT|nr:hypothetical protein [Blastopirellula marina]PQO44733.1 hypothetical protein C5Y93_18390 [Blastopirellula marina]